MKKVFSKVALAGLGVAMAATSASAVGIDVYQSYRAEIAAANKGPLYIANEALDVTNGISEALVGDIGLGFDGTGVVIVTTSVKNPSDIVFSMEAGASLSAPTDDAYLLGVWVDNDDDNIIDTNEITLVTDATGAPAVGSAVGGEIAFSPASGSGLNNGADTDLSVGSKLIIMTGDEVSFQSPTGGLNFDIEAGQAHDATYTLNVSEHNGAATASTTLAKGMNQFELCAQPLMDGEIDLEAVPSRTSFLTGVVIDSATVVLSNRNGNASCNDGIEISGLFAAVTQASGGSVESYVVTLSATDQAIDTMDVSVDGASVDDTDYLTGGWSSVEVPFADVNVNVIFNATVTGTDAILSRGFDVSAVSTPESDDFLAVTYTDDAGIWRSKGYSASIPYVPFGVAGFNAFFKVANLSTMTDGDISVSAICTEYVNGVADGSVTGSGVIKTSTTQSDLTVSQAELSSAIGLGAGVYHCAVTLFVDVEAENVRATAFQSDPVGRTMLPLYVISPLLD